MLITGEGVSQIYHACGHIKDPWKELRAQDKFYMSQILYFISIFYSKTQAANIYKRWNRHKKDRNVFLRPFFISILPVT